MNTIIKIENATKRFKDKVVFENLNLTIEKGKSYGFIGYNGCGKSILFKTICGFSRLNEGRIIYKDKQIGKDIDFIFDAGVLIETPNFIGSLSGFKNLKMIAEIKKQISDEEIFETMQLFDLYDDRNKKVRAYSLGMKQKLRLAQAFMEQPELLILDEPTNGLDKKSVKNLHTILNQFVQDGGTLLLTSHNQEDIYACCNTLYEFEDASLKLQPSPKESENVVV